jgi:Flp pilus assembly protein TadG
MSKKAVKRSAIMRLCRDRRGGVATTFALAMVPAVFLIGMGLDFALAIQRRTQLNAAADAAVLAAVTPAMMTQSDTAATTAVTNMFNALASGISGVSYTAPTVTVSNAGLTRTVTISYAATSGNNFPSILGNGSWPVSGTAQATSSTAPNINFYLLLDNSPSMDLPATSSGITAMINATKNAPSNGANAGGCAFACHESNPSGDNLGNPGGEDNYQLAKNLGVVTRIQNMNSATQALMASATATAQANGATYGMAIYTFNGSGLNTIYAPSGQPSSNLSAAQTAAAAIDVLEVYDNNYLTKGTNNNDTDTNFETAMSAVNAIMPNPGTGAATSTPQEVLFIVSDGVDDEVSSSCSQALDGTRCQQPFNTTWCTTVKNRGIMIAVLYTEYLPLPSSGTGSNAWYNQWIAPFQSQIAGTMKSCASPGLYFQVTTDGDINAAMQQLFQQSVATARLSQ